ncbi:nuclear fragile X mental retardation protein interacting protein 1 [Planoprotostelium fungivorum]|uniref:Nuclear fragile X mental retardation protein interacting protein 1 n=1 Tax=Planoprotostelium fungivorum TaxID=1890364 RepID=A0A2P6N9F2_9EUKA|nr:nuclear fragile X mental retardation protein interacting protein 1 [Planoprotostelium fungivorum]
MDLGSLFQIYKSPRDSNNKQNDNKSLGVLNSTDGLQSSDNSRGFIHNPNFQYIVPSEITQNSELYCDNCEREFPSQQKYETHLSAHIKCDFPGCRFEAMSKAIEYHKENIHCNPQLQQMMQRLSSPEEIARWRQDRVRNFPTKDNIARKVFLKRLTQLIHNSYKSSKSERIEVDDLVEISSLLPGEIQERPYGQDKLQGGSNDKRKRRQETSGSYRRDKKHKEGHTRKPLSDDKQEKIETSTKSQEQENETKHIQLEKTSKTEGIDPTARCCTEEKTTVEGNPQGIVHSKQETKEVADETIREEELPLKNSDDEVPEETAIAKRGEDIFKREDEDRMSNPVNKTQLCRKYLQKRFIHDIEAQKEHIMQMRQKRSERDSKNRARKEKTEKKATLLQKTYSAEGLFQIPMCQCSSKYNIMQEISWSCMPASTCLIDRLSTISLLCPTFDITDKLENLEKSQIKLSNQETHSMHIH